MTSYRSNIDELAAGTAPGVVRMDGGLGDRIAGTIAGRIAERGERGEGPDGPWDRNAPATVKAKGFDKPNYETGRMMDPANIKGDVQSDAARMEMTYGTGEADEDGVTDREKATYAHDGQSHRKIKRPFFGLNDGDCDAVTDLAADEWDRAAGGAPVGP